jgi:hypothetical protein
MRHGVRLAGVGIIVAGFAIWIVRTYNAAIAISISASRNPISDASTPTGEDGVTLRVAFRRQRPVRVDVERCEAEIQLLGSPHGVLDVESQVGWALTQALHATDDGNSLASGDEASYQVSFWVPRDRAMPSEWSLQERRKAFDGLTGRPGPPPSSFRQRTHRIRLAGS